MATRSLLALGLVAASAVTASPIWGQHPSEFDCSSAAWSKWSRDEQGEHHHHHWAGCESAGWAAWGSGGPAPPSSEALPPTGSEGAPSSVAATASATTAVPVPSSVVTTAATTPATSMSSTPMASSTTPATTSVAATSTIVVPTSSVLPGTTSLSTPTTTSVTVVPSTSTTLSTSAVATSGLADYARAAGKYMGTANDFLFTKELSDPYYMAELNNTHDWAILTPGNSMKWAYIEPQQNVFDYTASDQFVAIAKANNQLIRCHNLNWYNQNPTWLTNGVWTNETILAALENHISNVVAHFGDNCYHWDVVNEAFADDGTWRQDIWYNTTGTAFVYTAFAAAEAAVKKNNLKTKLYYNDYNIEFAGPKATAAQNLIASIKARGIQIDGAGLQSHFIVGSTPSTATQVSNMEAFAALGVEVAITELDIRTTTPATAAAAAQQVVDYASTVAACKQVSACVGVTEWDFVDEYSWIPGTFPGQGYANLFSQPNGTGTPLIRKASYDGVIDGWTGVVPT